MDDITTVLRQAYKDAEAAAEYNKDREPSIRPSRAGLPLIQLVLEDIVLPKLPRPPAQAWELKSDIYASTMRLSIGHLFEKTVEVGLRKQYEGTSVEVRTQDVLTLGDIQGSCDILVIDHSNRWACVVECKALKAYSVAEVKEQKLLVDNWGYLTQLALYVLSVRKQYPSYEVSGCWYTWIKPLEKHMKLTLPMNESQLEQRYADVLEKQQHYLEFKRDFAEGKLSYACGKLLLRTEDLPQKINAGSYMKGSCSLHFNRYCQLLTDSKGQLLDNAEDIMLLLTRAAYYGHDSEHAAKVTELLTQGN